MENSKNYVVVKNEVQNGNYLEIESNKDASEVAVVAQEWLEENYDCDEFFAVINSCYETTKKDLFIAKYDVGNK